MRYREDPAPPHLTPWVECAWSLRGRLHGAVQRVLPDGCVEVIVHRGEPMRQAGRPQPSHMLAGQMDRCLLLEPAGDVDVVGVRLRPEAARAFSRVPASELTNQLIELGGVCGEEFGRRLGEAKSLGEVWSAVEDRLRGAAAPDAVAASAVRAILAEGGAKGVDRMAERLGVSGRHLNRLFGEHVGLAPNVFARILRFQRTLAAWERHDWPRLADVAAECGFYDQAHMCHEFFRFCGRNPSDFFQQPEVMARLFSRARRASDSYKLPR